jgi:hypothetical protein
MAFRLERKIVSPKLTLKLEIELNDSTMTPEEAAQRLEYLINTSGSKAFSGFIVELIRQTNSTTWELKSCSLD